MTAKELFVLAYNCDLEEDEEIAHPHEWKNQPTKCKKFYRKILIPLKKNNYDLFIKTIVTAHWDEYYRTEEKELIKWGNKIWKTVHNVQFNDKMKDFLNEEN